VTTIVANAPRVAELGKSSRTSAANRTRWPVHGVTGPACLCPAGTRRVAERLTPTV